MRLDGSTPVRYSLREEMDHKYLDLKKVLSELCGIAVHSLQLCEVMAACVRVSCFSHQIELNQIPKFARIIPSHDLVTY